MTLDRLASALQPSLQRVLLDGDAELLAGRPSSAPEMTVHGENAAYVLYTSGAAGAPKGVVVPHRSLAHLIDAASGRYRLGRQDRVLLLSSIAFDAAAEEIWPTLAAGGTVVPFAGSDSPSVPELLELIDRNAVTVAEPADAVVAHLGGRLARFAAAPAALVAAAHRGRPGRSPPSSCGAGKRPIPMGRSGSTPTASPKRP